MKSICYHHQQVPKWQRNWNGQDSSVPCSNPLGPKDTQVYGNILLKDLTNQAMLESKAYKAYYAFASRKKTLKPNSHASGSGDGVDTQSKVPDEQLQMTFDSESKKESWGDSDEDDEDDLADDADDNDDERMESNRDEIPDPNLTNVELTEHEEEEYCDQRVYTPPDYQLTEEEKIDDEEMMDEEAEDEVTKELYTDVNVNLGNEDAEMTNADQGGGTTKMFHTNHGLRGKWKTSCDTLLPVLTLQEEVKTQLPQILPQAVSDFATPVIEKNVTESLKATVLTRSSSQPKSFYEVAALLSEFKLTKILLDKMEESKSHLRADYKKKLYDALFESYNTEKDRFNTYGEVFTLKRSQDDSDKDQDPSVGSDRGTKRRKSSKEAESSKDSRSKEKKSSKDAFRSQHKSSGKSAQAKEPSKPYPFDLSKPFSLIRDHRGRQIIPHDFIINNDLKYLKGGDLSRQNSTLVMKIKAATYEIKWIKDLVHNLWSPVKRIIAVTRLSIMKKYDYVHLEEIEVHREDQKLYKFREGDFPLLCLQDIEDMLLLLVQHKLTNLIIDERNGMLDDVRSAFNDIAKGIRMEYLPKRKWSGLDKRRAWVMVGSMKSTLYKRRLMRNLEKFVGGTEYGNDLRLLEQTI
ncbi:hypothetical protein Tco_0448431 [Tanacetum coccineum]